jgi:hypothetical protein
MFIYIIQRLENSLNCETTTCVPRATALKAAAALELAIACRRSCRPSTSSERPELMGAAARRNIIIYSLRFYVLRFHDLHPHPYVQS